MRPPDAEGRAPAASGSGGVLPISVVIPARNAAPFLGDALASVQAQTRRPAETIVVDDGSSDETSAVAGQFGVTVLRQAPTGLSAARNAGILAARGAWIAFLDADDIWEPTKLEAQWEAVERCPEVGMVATDFVEFNGGGLIPGSFLARKTHYRDVRRTEVHGGIMRLEAESFHRQFLEGNFIAPATVLARRDLLIEVGLFWTGVTHVEDREMWLRLLAVTDLAVVERVLVRCRLHETNMSHDALRMALGNALVADQVCQYPHRYIREAAERYRPLRPKLWVGVGRAAEERGDLADAGRHYMRAWRLGGGLRALALAALTRCPAWVRRLVRAGVTGMRRARTRRARTPVLDWRGEGRGGW